MIEQAAKCKAEGNAHFTAQRNNAALEAYKEGVAILPVRKVTPKKKPAEDGGKGKGRETSDSDAEDQVQDNASSNQIRELADDEDEKAFVEEGKISDEERQVIELRGALWNNLAVTQMRLVCTLSSVQLKCH